MTYSENHFFNSYPKLWIEWEEEGIVVITIIIILKYMTNAFHAKGKSR